jgi:hypothetical protein
MATFEELAKYGSNINIHLKVVEFLIPGIRKILISIKNP